MTKFALTAADRKINEEAEARAIIMDHLRGVDKSVIAARLQALSKTSGDFGVDGKERFQKIKLTSQNACIPNGIHDVLNELSIDGVILHLMTLDDAETNGYTGCYVWDESYVWRNEELKTAKSNQQGRLSYIPLFGKVEEYLELDREKISARGFTKEIKALPHFPHHKKKNDQSIYLSAEQREELITKNTLLRHDAPHITEHKRDYLDENICPNLYAALKKLSDNHEHIRVLVDMIDETRIENSWWLYFMSAATLTAISGAIFYLKDHVELIKNWFNRTLPVVTRLFGNTVYLLRNTPLIGMVSNGLPLIYAWYKSFIDDTFSDTNKQIKLLLKTLIYSLPILGYTLCYLAAGAMTMTALYVFVTGALIDVIEPIVTWFQGYLKRRNNPQGTESEYNSAANKTRSDIFFQRDGAVLATKVLANLATTAAVIIWCVFPPSLAISLPCIVFSQLVTLAKDFKLKSINNYYDTQGQKLIREIYFSTGKAYEINSGNAKAYAQAYTVIDTLQAQSKRKTPNPPSARLFSPCPANGDSQSRRVYNPGRTRTQDNNHAPETNTQRTDIVTTDPDSTVSGVSLSSGIR